MREKLLETEGRIVSHSASNPASSTDQPKRIYGLVYVVFNKNIVTTSAVSSTA